MELDIVLLPPKKLSAQIGAVTRHLNKKYGLSVAVDNKKLFPHISLLHLKASPQKIKKIIQDITKLHYRHRQCALAFSKPWGGKLFVVLGIKKAQALYKLHKDVVANMAKYRNGIVDLGRGRALSEHYFKAYGVANIQKYFRPHITLGHPRVKKDGVKILREAGEVKLPKFTANRLAIAEVNQHHQVIKIIKEFKLL